MDTFDALRVSQRPTNEPTFEYEPGSRARLELERALSDLRQRDAITYPHVIAGREVVGQGSEIAVVEPHRHRHQLGTLREATTADVQLAIDSALAAGRHWRALSFADRAGIFLKAADLISGPWRARLNAATMLGQSKTAYQAEIDAACELADFLRFNVYDGFELISRQPHICPAGVRNEMDHRPLEGFVLAITPFNFTAIAANLPAAPALMGNTVVWKPSPTQQEAASLTMAIFKEAGLPDGVINMVTGNGAAVSEVAVSHRDLAGIHFTGSTATFRHLWQSVSHHLASYRSYPRLVGETGGKDFVLAHEDANLDALRTALIRGAFDFQGQKCSAASRAYLPSNVGTGYLDELADVANSLTYGDVADLSNFGGAVIDRRSFTRLAELQDRLRHDSTVTVIAGGTNDDSEGFFIRPTIVVSDNPHHEIFTTEFFGPVLAVHLYDPARFDETCQLVDATSPYALTGALWATDREVITRASAALRYSAGNFYINDKPTGAVVGQQPFGGARASGTNDKAGSIANLERWVSPRTIKETFVPPTQHGYRHQD